MVYKITFKTKDGTGFCTLNADNSVKACELFAIKMSKKKDYEIVSILGWGLK